MATVDCVAPAAGEVAYDTRSMHFGTDTAFRSLGGELPPMTPAARPSRLPAEDE
jgi:hypothetical protein